MKTPIRTLAALAALVALAACNTVYGLGEDIEAAGKGLQNSSETVEEQITGDG